jgi:uncharacterized protein (TIGR02145 family)
MAYLKYNGQFVKSGNQYLGKAPPPLMDIDGNVYSTVIIGTQEWITRNLDVTRYADGSTIPTITGTSNWAAAIAGAKCYYNDDEATYRATYGTMYNSYALSNVAGFEYLHKDGVNQNFRVPSNTDFSTLISYLGGTTVAGGKIKSTSLWTSNVGATNESGFTALGGGYRTNVGGFAAINTQGIFWSSSFFDGNNRHFYLSRNSNTQFTQGAQTFRWGLSVRLMRDI